MDRTQRGVALGMALALLTSVVILLVSALLGIPGLNEDATTGSRALVLASSILIAAIPLFFCVARLARHRFFTPEDINGSALTEGTARARLLQALLQNTLEQLTLALATYAGCAFIFPPRYLAAVPASAALFLIGRALFFAGYSKGAASRAFGFALTFYPSLLMAAAAIVFLVNRIAG